MDSIRLFDKLKKEIGDPAWVVCDYLFSDNMVVYDKDDNLLNEGDRVVIWKTGSLTLPPAQNFDYKIIVHLLFDKTLFAEKYLITKPASFSSVCYIFC